MPLDSGVLPDDDPAQELKAQYGHLTGLDFLDAMINDAFPGRIAVSSSFGTESAVLLHQVAQVAPATPVLFLDTGMLFAQTIQYEKKLRTQLGLTDVRVIRPDPDYIKSYDPDGTLHKRDTDSCCHMRKVLPMEHALQPFDAWITGRKRIHGGLRATLSMIEHDGKHYKINPMVDWTPEQIKAAFTGHGLPRHPLEVMGYTSVGCYPCTGLPEAGTDSRSGRWAGQDKTECGIHKAPWAGEGI
ncbi:MAG: phosphoadenylyl-sulfate reductase [Rhodospirillales bacterium]|jgi:phosphoadenosine phosphosulfate reductase|nr:phosphoadenylyl-sulfate reductase [Rhodospirillales bacterium]MBT4039648.1 phosphoadenylyl-sulfate reductase [Rhodospirillales bacterium]MBT4625257.1 phosphoadenylyl-sulfate reductase [Rhodospirillales bacterium]MBT5352530.1 phosphoadenylyl-sulfate reductase [Rhodospirillales bacterium]MBT5519510.1 phosphoadenylyl-sulfate reductase [Rhodospirillales bacterium]